CRRSRHHRSAASHGLPQNAAPADATRVADPVIILRRMECPEPEALTALFLGDRLSDDERKRLLAHVAECEACSAAIGALSEQASTSRSDRTSPDSEPRSSLIEIDASYYSVGEEIGRGGMGRIRVAKDRRLDRKVAIKELLRGDNKLARRFEREARITARLQHPSIVSVHEAGCWSNGIPFYAMPFIEGRSLEAVLGGARTLEERLALVPHVLAVADAMAYAHGHGIIHRDLKPRNVM